MGFVEAGKHFFFAGCQNQHPSLSHAAPNLHIVLPGACWYGLGGAAAGGWAAVGWRPGAAGCWCERRRCTSCTFLK